jgi:peroxiredoxin
MRTFLKVYSNKLLARSIIELDKEDSVISSALIASSSASPKVLDLPPAEDLF